MAWHDVGSVCCTQCKHSKASSRGWKLNKNFTQERIKWSYILEKAPWWGGFYERLVKSLKSSVKKTIGRAKLKQDELVTGVAEAEMILNCRPISYVSSEDLEEPLIPAHLIIGRRISALPEVDSPVD